MKVVLERIRNIMTKHNMKDTIKVYNVSCSSVLVCKSIEIARMLVGAGSNLIGRT